MSEDELLPRARINENYDFGILKQSMAVKAL